MFNKGYPQYPFEFVRETSKLLIQTTLLDCYLSNSSLSGKINVCTFTFGVFLYSEFPPPSTNFQSIVFYLSPNFPSTTVNTLLFLSLTYHLFLTEYIYFRESSIFNKSSKNNDDFLSVIGQNHTTVENQRRPLFRKDQQTTLRIPPQSCVYIRKTFLKGVSLFP